MSSPQPIIVGNIARPLLGKVALVTGASRGIGAAVAKAFAAAGADVAISYSSSPEKAQEVVKAIEAAGQKGIAIKADHSVLSEVDALVHSAAKFFGGRLDILVNNAGVFVGGAYTDPAHNTPEKIADIQRLFNINVNSVAQGTRTASQYLKSGGRIISIGSVVGSAVPFPGAADYAATKSALQSYTRGWARDFAPKGVTVNLVQPGAIATDMNPVDGPFAAFAKSQPLGRHGTVEELAAAVLFLATPSASFITASIFDVDGGALA